MSDKKYCYILVVEGKELPPHDSNGLADPFVIVRYNKKKAESECIKKTLEPKWDFICDNFVIDDPEADEVELTVMDWDLIGSNDFISKSHKIPIHTLFEGVEMYQKVYDWIQLYDKEGKEAGQVHIKMAIDDLAHNPELGKTTKERSRQIFSLRKHVEKVITMNRAKSSFGISLPSPFSKKDKPKPEDPETSQTQTDAGQEEKKAGQNDNDSSRSSSSAPTSPTADEQKPDMTKVPSFRQQSAPVISTSDEQAPEVPEYQETPAAKDMPTQKGTSTPSDISTPQDTLKSKLLKRVGTKSSKVESPQVISDDPVKHKEHEYQTPKWIPDEDVDVCMICPTKFSMFKRKHHCRLCGYVVCHNCSAHQQEVDGQMGRVCDVCFDSSRKTGSKNVVGRAFGSVKSGVTAGLSTITSVIPIGRKEAKVEDDGHEAFKGYSSKSQLDWWLYLLKPFSHEGAKLPIGALNVSVIKGLNLPQMDMFGKSDPFCEVFLTQPGGEKKKQKTSTIMKTLNPQWNSSHSFRVTSSLCSLRVNVYDYDTNADDDLIGHVEIPLSDLADGHKIVEKVYHLKLSDDAKLIQAKVKKETSKKNKKLKDTYELGDKKPRILLNLEYKFSKAGEFASYFVKHKHETEPEQDFDMDVFYNGAMDLMELMGPIFAVLGEITTVLQWSDPFKSVCVLIPFMICCLYTWVTPIIIQLWLIRYMFWQFVLVRWKTQDAAPKPERSETESKEDVDSEDEEDAEKLEAKKIEERRKKERESHLNGLLVGMANSTMAGAGMKETLQWLQNLILYINVMMKYVFGLFQWTHPPISRSIFIILCCTFVYSCFLPFQYVVLLGGTYVLCMNTVPLQIFYWVMMGLVMYLTRARATAEKRFDKLKEDFIASQQTFRGQNVKEMEESKAESPTS